LVVFYGIFTNVDAGMFVDEITRMLFGDGIGVVA
jgi:hypothetical protein